MKSKVVIVVVVLLIIIFACILILNKNNTKTIINSSGEIQIDNELKQKMLDKMDEDVKNGYTLIEKNNVTSSSDISIDTIAYKDVSDESGDKTLVNVYITNVGNEPIYNNEVLTISLFNKNGDMLYCFGAIIESNKDIEKGESVVLKTQYLGKANDIVKAEVSFDHAD